MVQPSLLNYSGTAQLPRAKMRYQDHFDSTPRSNFMKVNNCAANIACVTVACTRVLMCICSLIVVDWLFLTLLLLVVGCFAVALGGAERCSLLLNCMFTAYCHQSACVCLFAGLLVALSVWLSWSLSSSLSLMVSVLLVVFVVACPAARLRLCRFLCVLIVEAFDVLCL